MIVLIEPIKHPLKTPFFERNFGIEFISNDYLTPNIGQKQDEAGTGWQKLQFSFVICQIDRKTKR